MSAETIIIRNHPRSANHWRAIVETKRGYAYFADWATRPMEQDVRAAWKHDRKAFQPYHGH